MKLHAPQFEKALRRGVRKAIKGSRTLKQDFKAAKRFRRNYSVKVVLRPAASVLLVIMLWGILDEDGITTAVGFLNLWILAFIGIQAHRLRNNFYNPSDRAAFAYLPIETRTILRWELQKTARSSIWFLLDLLCAYSTFAVHFDTLAAWLAVIPMACLTALHVFAVAAIGVAYRPQFPFGLLPTAALFAGYLLPLGLENLGFEPVKLLAAIAPTLNVILPSGWVASLFESAGTRDFRQLVVLLIPISATLLMLRSSIRQVFSQCENIDPIRPEMIQPPADEADSPEENDAAHVSAGGTVTAGITEIEEIIRTRRFVSSSLPLADSWLERFLWRWLSSRERALLEFASPDGVFLLPSWMKLFRNLGITIAAVVLMKLLINPALVGWLLLPGLFITGCHLLSLLAGTGRAFEKVACSGVHVPFYAGYGIGFRELSQLFTKLSVVQLPLVTLYSLAATFLTFFALDEPLLDSLPFGLKVAGLLFASRFFFLMFSFSSGTNDTSSLFRIRPILLVGTMVTVCVAFIAFAAASLMVPDPAGGWMFWAAAPAMSWVALKFYSFFYHSKTFDLMNIPQQQL